jgi:hypothetical protein
MAHSIAPAAHFANTFGDRIMLVRWPVADRISADDNFVAAAYLYKCSSVS